jgi:hypothetical protein
MVAYEDPFRQIEEALRFYAWCPTDDGLKPAGPNKMLAADNGELARAALGALMDLRDKIIRLDDERIALAKAALQPPVGLPDRIGLYEEGDR